MASEFRIPVADFYHWLDVAAVGERIEYYRGFLAADRDKDPSIDIMAAVVMTTSEMGYVKLTQRKAFRDNDPWSIGTYRYYATRTEKKASNRPHAVPEHPTHSESAAGRRTLSLVKEIQS